MLRTTVLLALVALSTQAAGSIVFTHGESSAGWDVSTWEWFQGASIHQVGLAPSTDVHYAAVVYSGTQISRTWIDSTTTLDRESAILTLSAVARVEAGMYDPGEMYAMGYAGSWLEQSFTATSAVEVLIDGTGLVQRNAGMYCEGRILIFRDDDLRFYHAWDSTHAYPTSHSASVLLEPGEWTILMSATAHVWAQPRDGVIIDPYANVTFDASVRIVPAPAALALFGLCLAPHRRRRRFSA